MQRAISRYQADDQIDRRLLWGSPAKGPQPGSPGCAPSAPTTPGGARWHFRGRRPGPRAALGQPTAVAADGASLVLADQITRRIRQVAG